MDIKNLNQQTYNQTINEAMRKRRVYSTNVNGKRYWNLNEDDKNNEVNKANKKVFFAVIFGASIISVLIFSLSIYLFSLVFMPSLTG
tara:strand:- start:527 stop:787 length:261 start_codon:yes stop_codon:yes gene_type:complete